MCENVGGVAEAVATHSYSLEPEVPAWKSGRSRQVDHAAAV